MAIPIPLSGANKIRARHLPLRTLAGVLGGLLATVMGHAAPPSGLSPGSDSRSSLPFPSFAWSADPAAFAGTNRPTAYEIQIASDADFAKLVDKDEVWLNRYVHDRALPAGDYFWRVRAKPTGEPISEWSEVGTFIIQAPDETMTVEVSKNPARQTTLFRSAVNQAVRAAKDGESVRVDVPTGDYHVDNIDGGYLLRLVDCGNVVIDGNGSRIFFAGRDQGLVQATRVRGLVVMGFELHYPKGATFLQGWVREVDRSAGTVTLEIEEGLPGYESPDVSPGNGTLHVIDPKIDGRQKTGASNFYRAKGDGVRNDNGTWTLTLDAAVDGWEVGDRFIHSLQDGSASVTRLTDCEDVTVSEITSYGGGALHFTAFEGSGFNVLRCRLLPPEGMWYGGNADGVHVRGYRVGPWIEGCEFRGIGDDGVALYSRPATMIELHPEGDANEVVCSDKFFTLEEGDAVSFFRADPGTILLETTVREVRDRRDGTCVVRFDAEIPDDLRTEGEIQDVDQIWNRSKSCGDFVIRHNHFENIRRYGIVSRSRRGVVEENTLIGVSGSAIVVKNGAKWPNGLYSSDLVIRNNSIRDTSFENNESGKAIAIRFLDRQQNVAEGIGPRGILIEGNTLAETPEPEIEIVSSRDIVVRGNRVIAADGAESAATVKEVNSEDVVRE